MDCKTAFETYLLLDQHDSLPFKIKIHCITCKKCKNLMHKIQYSIDSQQKSMSEPVSFEDALLCATMTNIYKINNTDADHQCYCSHKVIAVGFNTLCYDAKRRGIKPSAQIKEQQQKALNGKEKHSFYSWIIIGILLITGFISVPFSEIGQWGLDQFGTQFTISFALLCAGSITGYAAMFLVKNITFFNKTLDF